MPLDPKEISAAGLPRSPLGGYKAGPTVELLKRVAWDYMQLVHECAKHAETVERLTRRTDELEAQVASLQTLLDGHKDPDELARTVLAMAQRAARELRESTRSEGEATLKKARARAQEIESEAQKRISASAADVTQLKQLRERVRAQLHETLDSMVAIGAAPSTNGGEVSEPVSGTGTTSVGRPPGRPRHRVRRR
ncbi:MAG TPA: DivIVA domain-containing protein [Gaiellaceae bacterium]